MPPNTIYVGRPGRFGNPFTYADAEISSFNNDYDSVMETLLEMYKNWLTDKISVDKDFLKPLMGKNLACWCPLEAECHADVLLEFIN